MKTKAFIILTCNTNEKKYNSNEIRKTKYKTQIKDSK